MRDVLPAGPGVCRICKTFVAPGFEECYSCVQHPNAFDLVAPITYSEHGGQVHTALRNYKDGAMPQVRRYAMVRLTAVLWRFLQTHERCVATAAGAAAFDLVTTVPSSTPNADEARGNLRTMVDWCRPVSDRFERVLRATGDVPPGRGHDAHRYAVTGDLAGRSVLLIDDTWVSGGHAQSAASALRDAGVGHLALVVIGRHIRPEWAVGESTSGELLRELPRRFNWDVCCVH